MIGVWIANAERRAPRVGRRRALDPSPVSDGALTLGPLNIAPLRLFVVLTAAALIGLAWLSSRDAPGHAMRATFQDRDTARSWGCRSEDPHRHVSPSAPRWRGGGRGCSVGVSRVPVDGDSHR